MTDRPDLVEKDMGKVNYKEFLVRYDQSGMTHKEFDKQEGISSNMVGYYLKRAREEEDGQNGFARIEVKRPVVRYIRITSPGGVIIEIRI